MSAQITLDTQIEDLVKNYPEAVGFLTRHGIRCIRCGEPLWCSLGELLDQDGVDDPHQLVTELNDFLKRK
ncbi:hypothetical protein AMJ44_01045 [candidate division WOR-1 bacterium DG_54_3]|uniref:DUF1858 domain-containing protein n=1 Tax=candidate division WOR-1 bacterium DG_54_3 TaxID=1703775 RepID=A0A0S7Y6J1_UNCSA|nr:MAG: hypothetical protein AMJ44_01045 [candidate division WOR-1 bacterium DG_54_3]